MIRIREQTEVRLVAIYPDRESLERALRRLRDEGFDMRDVSAIVQGFDPIRVPAGVVTTNDIAGVSAGAGAVTGFLCGITIGTAFLAFPGLGPVFVAGSFSAALTGAVEGAVVGAVIGGLGGALVGWGFPALHVQRYEMRVSEGKFLVLARADPEDVEYLRSVLAPEAIEQLEIYERWDAGQFVQQAVTAIADLPKLTDEIRA